MRPGRKCLLAVAALLTAAASLALVQDARAGGARAARRSGIASALVRDASGEVVARVALYEAGPGLVTVAVSAQGLEPGFHGFHVHAVGRCVPPGFASAGEHLDTGGRAHPHHAGDFPDLLVNQDGSARATFVTDRIDPAALWDADGSAVVVHALPDNHANVPRHYTSTPDAATLATGDAGDRIGCGVLTRPEPPGGRGP